MKVIACVVLLFVVSIVSSEALNRRFAIQKNTDGKHSLVAGPSMVADESLAISTVVWGVAGTIFDNNNCKTNGYGSDAGIGYFECSIIGSAGDCSVNQGWIQQSGGSGTLAASGTLFFWVTCEHPSSNAGGTPITIRTWSDSSCQDPLDLFNDQESFTGYNAECMAPLTVKGVSGPASISLVGGSVGLGLDVGFTIERRNVYYLPTVHFYGFQRKGCINRNNSLLYDYAFIPCIIGSCSQGSYFQASTGRLTGQIWATCQSQFVSGYSIRQDSVVFYSDNQCQNATSSLTGFPLTGNQADWTCFNSTNSPNIPYFGSYLMEYAATASSSHPVSLLYAVLLTATSLFLSKHLS